jgi:hypothetical protein
VRDGDRPPRFGGMHGGGQFEVSCGQHAMLSGGHLAGCFGDGRCCRKASFLHAGPFSVRLLVNGPVRSHHQDACTGSSGPAPSAAGTRHTATPAVIERAARCGSLG